VRVRPELSLKRIVLNSEEVLVVPRYAVVGVGDVIYRSNGRRFLKLQNGTSQVSPPYRRRVALRLGTRTFEATAKELDRDDELEGYRQLSAMHYRGDRGFGRKAVLVLRSRHHDLPVVLGFVEVTTGFLMNRPRTRVLAAGFRDGSVRWAGWGSEEMRTRTSLVCRISRLVISPELRGHGLGSILVRHAALYARSHFHAGGLRPLFLELTADMTKFVPFAERAGMHYIGETEGNLHRVARDMRYLLASQTLMRTPVSAMRARGILQAQRRYATSAALLAEPDGVEPVTRGLAGISGELGTQDYEKYFGILRLPRPTYLLGLTKSADRFIRARVLELGLPASQPFRPEPVQALSDAIVIDNLTLFYQSSVERTPRSTEVQEAFGIRPHSIQSLVLQRLHLRIAPGSVTLVHGASGSGKTTLLGLLAGNERVPGLYQEGSVTYPANARIGQFQDLDPTRPLIEVLADGRPTSEALYALNVAGLSDAKLYLRRYSELSNGQKYRAMLAALIDSDSNVWIADEFLSTLDSITAITVAENIIKHVSARGVTLVVGAPHFDAFIDVLRPDQVVRLVSPWEYKVLTAEEFGRDRAKARSWHQGPGRD